MNYSVLKFGGSSLLTAELRTQVIFRIVEKVKQGLNPVVVVSAMGRNDDPYATDTLISLVKKEDYRPDSRNLDLLASCGEVISAVVLAESLNRLGHSAIALTGGQAGIITDANFGNARIISINPNRVKKAISSGKIPIVTGFQGQSKTGEVTTLGRGGSDITAVSLGIALECASVEIFTDVDGVKTADPQLVPDAPTLISLTYQEIIELAHLGAKVVHPRAVEMAMEAGIDLKILATDQSGSGTTISRGGEVGTYSIEDRVVTGIAHLGKRAQVRITGPEDFNQTAVTLDVFQKLAANNISVDLIYLSPDLIAFIVDQENSTIVKEVLADLGLNITVSQGYAKVSVVGAGMHGVPGVMARVVRSLDRANVAIYQTTDSHANISCLIKETDLVYAVRALFDEFGLRKEG